MKKGSFSEKQIIQILKKAEAGISADEICRQYSISPTTFKKWKSKYPEINNDQHEGFSFLDGLRGFAALQVIFLHYTSAFCRF